MNSLIFKRVELIARRVPRVFHPFLYVAGGLFWLLGPPLVFLALMGLAALSAWGIGWIVYDWNGRPQNWELRSQRALAAQVANVLQPQRTNRVYFLGLPLDLPEERFRLTLQSRYGWKDAGSGALRLNDRVGMTFRTDESGIVTRVQVTAEGIDEQQMIGLIARCIGTWGEPLTTAVPIGNTGRAFEAVAWRDERGSVAFDFVPMRSAQPIYRINLSVVSERDPMFTARANTHGFPPAYRHLNALNESIERKAREAAEREAAGLSPLQPQRVGPGQRLPPNRQPVLLFE